jgi:epidermal growth factor receptor substrate 15
MSMPASIQLTPAERPGYAHLFALADPQSTGMVSGSAAVSFFALSGLPTPVLGSIWSIADSDNNGFLGPSQFSAALRLIGHAQGGKVVTEDLINEAGPMPTFKGITLPAHLTGAISTPSRSSSTMIQPQMTGSGGFGPNEIKVEDRARYTRIFASAGPQGGLLDGE